MLIPASPVVFGELHETKSSCGFSFCCLQKVIDHQCGCSHRYLFCYGYRYSSWCIFIFFSISYSLNSNVLWQFAFSCLSLSLSPRVSQWSVGVWMPWSSLERRQWPFLLRVTRVSKRPRPWCRRPPRWVRHANRELKHTHIYRQWQTAETSPPVIV